MGVRAPERPVRCLECGADRAHRFRHVLPKYVTGEGISGEGGPGPLWVSAYRCRGPGCGAIFVVTGRRAGERRAVTIVKRRKMLKTAEAFAATALAARRRHHELLQRAEAMKLDADRLLAAASSFGDKALRMFRDRCMRPDPHPYERTPEQLGEDYDPSTTETS